MSFTLRFARAIADPDVLRLEERLPDDLSLLPERASILVSIGVARAERVLVGFPRAPVDAAVLMAHHGALLAQPAGRVVLACGVAKVSLARAARGEATVPDDVAYELARVWLGGFDVLEGVAESVRAGVGVGVS